MNISLTEQQYAAVVARAQRHGYMLGYTDGKLGDKHQYRNDEDLKGEFLCKCGNFAETDVDYCADCAPYLKPSSDKKPELVGRIRI